MPVREVASTSRGRSAGSWEKSQSIVATSSPAPSACSKPAMYAGPRPSLRSRWRTSRKPTSAASRSASVPVPSGDASSITRTRASRSWSVRTAPSVCTMGSEISRSSYVGRQTMRLTGVSSSLVPAKLPTNTELAERFEPLPTCWSSTARMRSDLPPGRAAARIRESAVPVAQLASSTGRRRVSRGSAGRSRARSASSRPAT